MRDKTRKYIKYLLDQPGTTIEDIQHAYELDKEEEAHIIEIQGLQRQLNTLDFELEQANDQIRLAFIHGALWRKPVDEISTTGPANAAIFVSGGAYANRREIEKTAAQYKKKAVQDRKSP